MESNKRNSIRNDSPSSQNVRDHEEDVGGSLRNPDNIPSSEAAHVALFFANVAWNESVGLDHAREGYRGAWETIEAENPELWNEFKSNDIDGMIDELAQYKKEHFSDDERRILTCGIPDGKVRVEWVPAADPGVDSKWEMHLYGKRPREP